LKYLLSTPKKGYFWNIKMWFVDWWCLCLYGHVFCLILRGISSHTIRWALLMNICALNFENFISNKFSKWSVKYLNINWHRNANVHFIKKDSLFWINQAHLKKPGDSTAFGKGEKMYKSSYIMSYLIWVCCLTSSNNPLNLF